MILLAIDTSTPRAALALGLPDGSIRRAEADPRARHGRALLADLRDLLATAGLSPGDLDAIAVGLGPGSYTGLRVGVTAAKTLAYALNLPMVGLDSLAVIARNAPDDAPMVSVIADAQRGDAYVGRFRRDRPGSAFLPDGPTRVEPEGLWRPSLAPGSLLIGPAVGRFRDLPASTPPPDDPIHFPDPARLLDAGRSAIEAGDRAEPWFLEPSYLRRSAAEDLWESRGPR